MPEGDLSTGMAGNFYQERMQYRENALQGSFR
jgi:hypothetical protein